MQKKTRMRSSKVIQTRMRSNRLKKTTKMTTTLTSIIQVILELGLLLKLGMIFWKNYATTAKDLIVAIIARGIASGHSTRIVVIRLKMDSSTQMALKWILNQMNLTSTQIDWINWSTIDTSAKTVKIMLQFALFARLRVSIMAMNRHKNLKNRRNRKSRRMRLRMRTRNSWMPFKKKRMRVV